MTKLNELYRCKVCKNIVEVVLESDGILVCHDQPMELLEERQLEEGGIKHIPLIEKKEDKVIVKVGEVAHPMEEEHYIAIVELIVNGKVFRKFLNPGDAPVAEFEVSGDAGELKAREYCTVHGLWPS
ncbi:desulfoferrodoxin [Methanobrevibacter curvatus]|uniref:Desulfoferrodoxin n=1 Tax=Methanobrevibacter curvatus TaxID=49547 RepID=A0A165ZDE1_9EURY|nr:desulfoferrodoxin [Methanobrevibacter curvatus]KZX10568.1 desulfoferrodoxin [Methanobrevibacter curvatus]